MYKMTNIETIGTEYTVTDQTGKVIKTIQIIPHNEILDAALGSYDSDIFPNISNYLSESISVLTGFDGMSPLNVLWYSTTEEEVVLSQMIEYAVKHGYDKIILEHLDEDEELI